VCRIKAGDRGIAQCRGERREARLFAVARRSRSAQQRRRLRDDGGRKREETAGESAAPGIFAIHGRDIASTEANGLIANQQRLRLHAKTHESFAYLCLRRTEDERNITNGTNEQFNTPVGRITYNIVQIKSKREKNQLQA